MKGYGDIDMALNGNELGIFLKALLDPNSLKDIKTEISNLQNLFDKSPIKIKLDVEGNEFKQFSANIQKLSTEMNKSLNLNVNTREFDNKVKEYKVSFNEAGEEVKKLKKEVITITDETGKQIEETKTLKKETNELGQKVEVLVKTKEREIDNQKQLQRESEQQAEKEKSISTQIENQIKLLQTRVQLLKQNNWTADTTSADNFSSKLDISKIDTNNYKTQLADLNNEYSQIASITQESHKNNLSNLQKEIQLEETKSSSVIENWKMRLNAEEQERKLASSRIKEQMLENSKLESQKMNALHTEALEMNRYYDQQKQQATQLSLYKQKMIGMDGTKGELDIFSQKYKGKFDSTELESLKKRINELNISTPELNTKMKQLGIEFSSMRQQASQSASVLSRTLENFTKFARFYIAGGFIVGAVNNLKDAMTTLKEIDSQMVEIAKVTNLSADAMTKLKDSSFDTASDFGRKAQDYLSAVTEFSRAGYELQSSELSKVSLLAQNVGELTSEQANEFLIATDAAYKYKGSQEELTRVLDGVNQIDNKFATSIQKVSEGITRAGSIASNAKIGINELSAALGTMTAVTQRSGSEMGNAFKGIVMNLMQVKG